MDKGCKKIRLVLVNGQTIEISIKGKDTECEKYIDYMRNVICVGHLMICSGQCEIDVEVEAIFMENSISEINSRQIIGIGY